jgi:2-acylglycerol O-acyltransferase 2
MGALCNFATNATGFEELFPGVDLRLLTLAMNFKVPFFREFLLGLGINDASGDSCRRNLTRGRGSSIMLVVGGARESLETKPGHLDVVLQKRKGFVKMALRTGASLVPVMSFGENDVFGIYSNSTMFKWQVKMQKKLGFAVPMFYGKALAGGLLHRVFGMDVGVMPLRVPIHSVVGRPIHVEKDEKPSQESIDKVHQQYMDELKRITDEYRETYEKERTEALEKCTDAQRLQSLEMQKKSFNTNDYHVDQLCMVDS